MPKITRTSWVLKKHIYTIAFLSWMVLIAVLSLSTYPQGHGPNIDIPDADKAVHFIFYFVATFLGTYFIRERTEGALPLNKALIQLMCIVIGYGILIEVFQWAFTHTRNGDPYDVLANSIGAFAAGALIKVLFCGKTRLKWKI